VTPKIVPGIDDVQHLFYHGLKVESKEDEDGDETEKKNQKQNQHPSSF